MDNPLMPQDNKPTVPGIGIAGEVICPIMSIGRIGGAPCVKHHCEFWVELFYGEKKVGRCALAWSAIIGTEQTTQFKGLNEVLIGREVLKASQSQTINVVPDTGKK